MSTAIVQYQANRNGSRRMRSPGPNGASARTTERSAPGVSSRGSHVTSSLRQPTRTRRAGTASDARETPVPDWLDRRLLDACRRDFPVCEKPFAEIARRVDIPTGEVLRRFGELERCGMVSRIGPVSAPESVGASTLVAMAVPKPRLRSIRETVMGYRGVGHICEREHDFNLWFGLAAPNAGDLYDTIADIRQRTGIEALDLRLERDYGENVGFAPPRRTSGPHSPPEASDGRLLAAIQEGLPLTVRPYAAVAKRLGTSEAQLIERLTCLLGEGLMARMGVVVGHGAHGLGANALVAFSVSRHMVDMVGERLAEAAWVDQCQRFIPRPPAWPYNLYCTLQDRDLARLICWVDEEFFGTVRCPGRAVLCCRSCDGACEEH